MKNRTTVKINLMYFVTKLRLDFIINNDFIIIIYQLYGKVSKFIH